MGGGVGSRPWLDDFRSYSSGQLAAGKAVERNGAVFGCGRNVVAAMGDGLRPRPSALSGIAFRAVNPELERNLYRGLEEATEKFLGLIEQAKMGLISTGILIVIAIGLWSLLPSIIEAIRRRLHLHRIRQGGAGASDAALLYLRMLAILRKRGFEKPSWLTPTEFARVIPESRTASLVQEFTGLYQQLRYGGTSTPGERMLVLLDELNDGRK